MICNTSSGPLANTSQLVQSESSVNADIRSNITRQSGRNLWYHNKRKQVHRRWVRIVHMWTDNIVQLSPECSHSDLSSLTYCPMPAIHAPRCHGRDLCPKGQRGSSWAFSSVVTDTTKTVDMTWWHWQWFFRHPDMGWLTCLSAQVWMPDWV